MQRVLIDVFIVPEESKADFGERTRSIQSFLKTLPGFVEGFVYEKKAGENRYNIITTAVWKTKKPLGMQDRPWQRSSKNRISVLKK